jgi:hypothetical protein
MSALRSGPRLVSHLRSNAIAYLALFVALGGTAYAVSLPANSVGTKQLKKAAVTKKKIKRNAVTTRKVKNFTLRSEDFGPGVLLQGQAGPTGATGPVGPTAAYYTDPGDGGDASFYPDLDTSINVDLPSSGRLVVFSHVIVHNLGCTSAMVGCNRSYALAVDDRLIKRANDIIQVTVPGTTKADSVNLIGITDTLAAGQHTLSLRHLDNANVCCVTTDPSPPIGAVLIGG